RINVPLEIARQISSLTAMQLRDNLIMAREVARLQTLLDASKQKALFLKGVVLSLLIYGDLGLRGSKDIDLLVPCEELSTTSKVLESAGYRRFAPPPTINEMQLRGLMRLRKDLCYMHEKTGLRVDLHWRLYLNPHAVNNASVALGSRLVPLTTT